VHGERKREENLTAETVVTVRLVWTVGSAVTDPMTWNTRHTVSTQPQVVRSAERICIIIIIINIVIFVIIFIVVLAIHKDL